MSRNPEMIGFIPTIKKPDRIESLAILAEQSNYWNRAISCTFNAGEKDEYSTTRVPSRHLRHGMDDNVLGLVEDMQNADFIHIIDLSER